MSKVKTINNDLEILLAAAKAFWFYEERHPQGINDEDMNEIGDLWAFLDENLSADEYDDALEHLAGFEIKAY